MRLQSGKIPKNILEEVIFKNLGTKRLEVALGPQTGIDGAVIDTTSKSIIVSMDPITGALERIGWLAVNINANDVATFGVDPAFFLSCIMLPEGSDRGIIETLSTQMDRAAKNLQIAIIGGHCEITPGLTNPIVVGCAMGTTERGNYVTAGGAKPGDRIIQTKTAGIEGTAILASDREKQLEKRVGKASLNKAKGLFAKISVVKEAIAAYKTESVNAMHDPTEGGIAGGIHEMADASNVGAEVFEDKIKIQPETAEVCEFFKIDPLQLIGSGALLIAAKPRAAEKVIEAIHLQGIYASVIGEFLKRPSDRVLIRKNGKAEPLPRPLSDHLWLALQR